MNSLEWEFGVAFSIKFQWLVSQKYAVVVTHKHYPERVERTGVWLNHYRRIDPTPRPLRSSLLPSGRIVDCYQRPKRITFSQTPQPTPTPPPNPHRADPGITYRDPETTRPRTNSSSMLFLLYVYKCVCVCVCIM